MKKVVAYYLQVNDSVKNAMGAIKERVPHVKMELDSGCVDGDYSILYIKCEEKYLANVENILSPYV